MSLIEIKEEELAMSSIFDILGPIMVGPSSSHTAGAVRIGYTARQLFGESVKRQLYIFMVHLRQQEKDMGRIRQSSQVFSG